ncbi:MAG: Flp pilus assembly protein CpaB [Planctomycetota bacterium]
MKGKAIIPLVLGLGIGLVAVKFVIDTVSKAKASGGAQQKITAIKTKQDIPAFTLLTAEMVELVETQENTFAPAKDRISKLEEAVGRVTAKAIPQFSPVLLSMLAPPGTSAGMEGRIKPGFRAVSVKIDEVSGVAYQIQPGDVVDVIVVMDIDSGERRKTKETIAKVIVPRAEVAAIGQSTATSAEDATSKVKPAKSATLLVTEEDAIKLHLAATRGKITLSLRGRDEVVSGQSITANSQDLFSSLFPSSRKPPEQVASAAPPSKPFWSSFGASEHEQTLPLEQDMPHGVTVYRRATSGNTSGRVEVERITFENARSSKIVDVGDRPVSRSASLLRETPAPRPAPANQRSPVAPGAHELEDDGNLPEPETKAAAAHE